MTNPTAPTTTEISIPLTDVELGGLLTIPLSASAIVIFAHGSGSSRHSPRNRFVADGLNQAGLATLLFDLLTGPEEKAEAQTKHLRFDINLLAQRLTGVVKWLGQQAETKDHTVGLFGASTGAAAALVAATELSETVQAVVSRGGRPDLAGEFMPGVKAPTMLIIGGNDEQVIDLNRKAAEKMTTTTRIDIVPGATHLFEEPGTLEQVAELSQQWFTEHL